MRKLIKKQTLILVVIITALLSCLAVGITSAKYYSAMTGSGSISTAKFDIEINGNPTDLNLSAENKTAGFGFTVKSNSDVAVSYQVVLTLPQQPALPSDVNIKLQLKENDTVINDNVTYSVSNSVYTFTDTSFNFTANDTGTHSFTLEFSTEVFSQTITIPDIQIEVVATQVNPN